MITDNLFSPKIEKDGEIERLTRRASELHKSKRQLMELLEQKDLEVTKKNVTIKSYHDKIVSLTENVASKDARVGKLEAELGRLQAGFVLPPFAGDPFVVSVMGCQLLVFIF
ncbi:nuclear pore anchor [Striga asiatica]|uniref:Nuclear pore anchor n=1 Tax=Striga asiatica TaxID=4170 RepID=A0A5A7PHP7_STRAF|nr:nuclear pore anchor [Striga asiatica]